MAKENTVEPLAETIPSPETTSSSLEEGEIKDSPSQNGGSNKVKKLASKIVLG